MNLIDNKTLFSNDEKFLLALHSCTEELGVGLIQLNNDKAIFTSKTFKANKDLSNYLFKYIEEILPSGFWHQIIRLAVATGPGGFTGTRLTIAFARIIAQQLQCPIDGISSFELMAYRIAENQFKQIDEFSFWIIQELKRRGRVGGKYQIILSNKKSDDLEIRELKEPKLIDQSSSINPSFKAEHDLQKDIIRLLNISLKLHKAHKKSKWQNVLPIYPTSPLDRLN